MTVERDVSPATEAGRSLMESLQSVRLGRWDRAFAIADILAIEQEAAALERRKTVEQGRARLAAALEQWFGPASDGMSAATRRSIVDETFAGDDLGDSR